MSVAETPLLVVPEIRSPYDRAMPNISAAAVSASLGIAPLVLDLNWQPEEEVLSFITRSKAQLILFTCMIDNYGSAIDIAQKIRSAHPSAKLVVGGPHVTLLASAGGKIDPVFDVVGEAEAIPSHGFVTTESSGEKQQIISAAGVKPLLSPSSWAGALPNWSAAFREHHLPLFMLEGSRGCPFHCQFCSHSDLAGVVLRTKPTEQILREMTIAELQFGVCHFRFTDSDLTSPGSRFIDICEAITDNNWARKPEWVAFARIGDLDPVKVGLAREAGCIGLFVGIESAKTSTLRDLRKIYDRNRAKETIKAARDQGLLIFANYMFGLPRDASSDWELIVEDVLDLGFQSANANPFYLSPNSEYARAMHGWGIRLVDELWLDHFHKVFSEGLEYFRTEEMTQAEMQTGVRKIRSALLQNGILWNLRDYHLLAWRSVGGASEALYKIWNNPELTLGGEELYAVQEMRSRGTH